MSVCLKRPSIYDVFPDHVKRCRLAAALDESIDLLQSHPSSEAAQEVLNAATAASCHQHLREDGDVMDDSPREPLEKRARLGGCPEPFGCMPSSGLGDDQEGDTREADVRGWAESVVKALHGCPSVEVAVQRCSTVLADMTSEVRRATLSEVEPTPKEQTQHSDELQSAQHTSRILMRAIRHLADRCKRLEGQGDEIGLLRQALEQSQEEQRRLQRANNLLKSHLELHLGNGSNGSLPWGSAVH